MIGGMATRSKDDWAILSLAMLGLAIMAYARIVMWGEDSRFDVVFNVGAGVTLFAVLGAVQWKLFEFFFAAIRWINRRDDPRYAKRPPEAP